MQRLSEKNLSQLYTEAYDRIVGPTSSAHDVAFKTFSWLLCIKENLKTEVEARTGVVITGILPEANLDRNTI